MLEDVALRHALPCHAMPRQAGSQRPHRTCPDCRVADAIKTVIVFGVVVAANFQGFPFAAESPPEDPRSVPAGKGIRDLRCYRIVPPLRFGYGQSAP